MTTNLAPPSSLPSPDTFSDLRAAQRAQWDAEVQLFACDLEDDLIKIEERRKVAISHLEQMVRTSLEATSDVEPALATILDDVCGRARRDATRIADLESQLTRAKWLQAIAQASSRDAELRLLAERRDADTARALLDLMRRAGTWGDVTTLVMERDTAIAERDEALGFASEFRRQLRDARRELAAIAGADHE